MVRKRGTKRSLRQSGGREEIYDDNEFAFMSNSDRAKDASGGVLGTIAQACDAVHTPPRNKRHKDEDMNGRKNRNRLANHRSSGNRRNSSSRARRRNDADSPLATAQQLQREDGNYNDVRIERTGKNSEKNGSSGNVRVERVVVERPTTGHGKRQQSRPKSRNGRQREVLEDNEKAKNGGSLVPLKHINNKSKQRRTPQDARALCVDSDSDGFVECPFTDINSVLVKKDSRSSQGNQSGRSQSLKQQRPQPPGVVVDLVSDDDNDEGENVAPSRSGQPVRANNRQDRLETKKKRSRERSMDYDSDWSTMAVAEVPDDEDSPLPRKDSKRNKKDHPVKQASSTLSSNGVKGDGVEWQVGFGKTDSENNRAPLENPKSNSSETTPTDASPEKERNPSVFSRLVPVKMRDRKLVADRVDAGGKADDMRVEKEDRHKKEKVVEVVDDEQDNKVQRNDVFRASGEDVAAAVPDVVSTQPADSNTMTEAGKTDLEQPVPRKASFSVGKRNNLGTSGSRVSSRPKRGIPIIPGFSFGSPTNSRSSLGSTSKHHNVTLEIDPVESDDSDNTKLSQKKHKRCYGRAGQRQMPGKHKGSFVKQSRKQTIEITDSDDECDQPQEKGQSNDKPVEAGLLQDDSSSEDNFELEATSLCVGYRHAKDGCKLRYCNTTNSFTILYMWSEQSKEVTFPVDAIEKVCHQFGASPESGGKPYTKWTFISFRVDPLRSSDLSTLSNQYLQNFDDEQSKKKRAQRGFVVLEFTNHEPLQTLVNFIERRARNGHETFSMVAIEEENCLFAKEVAGRLIEVRETEEKERIEAEAKKLRRRRRMTGNRGGTEKILVFPFDGDEAKIDAAAENLNEAHEVIVAAGTSSQKDSAVVPSSDDVAKAEGSKNTKRAHYLTIRMEDRERLCPGEFLNDTLIDFWMQWILRREDKEECPIHIFTSHFYTTLSEEGTQAVESWTAKKHIDIFTKSYVFVPVNQNSHWSLCVVVNPGSIENAQSNEDDEDRPFSCFFFFDSLRMHNQERVTRTLRKWLNCEWQRLEKSEDSLKRPFTEKTMCTFEPRVPRQDNSWDCGVFVCRYAYAMYMNRKRTISFNDYRPPEDDGKPFQHAVERNEFFRFNMGDIARLREDMGVLIDRLATYYKQWYEEREAKERVEKLEAEKSKTMDDQIQMILKQAQAEKQPASNEEDHHNEENENHEQTKEIGKGDEEEIPVVTSQETSEDVLRDEAKRDETCTDTITIVTETPVAKNLGEKEETGKSVVNEKLDQGFYV